MLLINATNSSLCSVQLKRTYDETYGLNRVRSTERLEPGELLGIPGLPIGDYDLLARPCKDPDHPGYEERDRAVGFENGAVPSNIWYIGDDTAVREMDEYKMTVINKLDTGSICSIEVRAALPDTTWGGNLIPKGERLSRNEAFVVNGLIPGVYEAQAFTCEESHRFVESYMTVGEEITSTWQIGR